MTLATKVLLCDLGQLLAYGVLVWVLRDSRLVWLVWLCVALKIAATMREQIGLRW